MPQYSCGSVRNIIQSPRTPEHYKEHADKTKITWEGRFHFYKRVLTWSVRLSKCTPDPEWGRGHFNPNVRELFLFPIDWFLNSKFFPVD